MEIDMDTDIKVVYGEQEKETVTASFVETWPKNTDEHNIESEEIMENISYKYDEDKIITDFVAYINDTYGEHYQTENNVQCFDAWIALGESTDTFRNTAMKYLWRYGKKNGSNKDDLMKALHYTIMCLYVDHYKDDNNGN